MRKPIAYIAIIISIIFLNGCTSINQRIDSQKSTIKGRYLQGKGCNGFVNEIETITSCEENNLYSGKIIEITGIIIENECDPELPQCFSGKRMKNIESIKIIY